MKQSELDAILARNPQVKADENPSRTQLLAPKPKRNPSPTLDSVETREVASMEKIGVSFVFYRVRLLDPDNAAGSCKDLLDGLAQAGLIPGDNPDQIRLEVRQEKVHSRTKQKTIIEIDYHEDKTTTSGIPPDEP